jgi:hypothetical protein
MKSGRPLIGTITRPQRQIRLFACSTGGGFGSRLLAYSPALKTALKARKVPGGTEGSEPRRSRATARLELT